MREARARSSWEGRKANPAVWAHRWVFGMSGPRHHRFGLAPGAAPAGDDGACGGRGPRGVRLLPSGHSLRRGCSLLAYLLLSAVALLGCSNPSQSIADVEVDAADVLPDANPYALVCNPDDPDPRGPACTLTISTAQEFDSYSIGPTSIQYWERATKYMVPAREGELLIPPLVQNSNRYPLHMEFLSALFFPGLTMQQYGELVTARATRQYYAGNLVRINHPERGVFYGFTIYTSAKASEQLEPVEVRRVYEQLKSIITAGPLVYTFEPFDALGPRKAQAWIDPGFPIYYPADNGVDVEVYTSGTAYGTVRLFTNQEFDNAVASGELNYTDIVVVEQVPFDLEAVVAGLVTGGRQWELGHVSIRLARRGTPNLYVLDALSELASWDGKLVKLTAATGTNGAADSYEIQEASLEEAQAWWEGHRPHLEGTPQADAQYQGFDSLLEMDTQDGSVPLVTRFGGKGANLATLYAFLDPKYQVPGFGIPFAWFYQFMEQNSIDDATGSTGLGTVSLNQFVANLAQDPEMATNAAYRHDQLARLRFAIRETATIDPALVAALVERIPQVFGNDLTPVRFRSSSNVEDALEFSGAGLYDSTTVCAADQTDSDSVGPSLCNSQEWNERTVERGLRLVWASLYNNKAWEERDWYQVPQTMASMAILVTLGFPDEAANGVAFTGDPSNPSDHRYLVNAQVGDEKVVSNDPSKVPELDRLEITDGVVTFIVRERSSTLAEPGVPVLSDPLLKELGALLAVIDQTYPLDLGDHSRESVLLDLEFKVVKGSGALKIKQIRPFLMNLEEVVPR